MTDAASARARIGAWLAPGVALALAAVAYRPLLERALHAADTYQIERWMFRPSELPSALVLAFACWTVAHRADALRALPPRRAVFGATTAALAALALFVWATLTRAVELLFPSLAASLLAFGAATRGGAGARALLFPAFVLLAGVPIPGPLRHEIVWRLQLATARSAAWLLDALGYEVEQTGVIFHLPHQAFHVIDGCSGLQGIAILTLCALIVRELFTHAGWRAWWPVLAAPGLGFVLNTMRVASVAAGTDAETLVGLGADHTPQGIAVLVAGAGALYALGYAAQRGRAPAATTSRPRHASSRRAWWAAAAGFAGLAIVGAALPPFPDPPRPELRPRIVFPKSGSGWTGEKAANDPNFTGVLPQGHLVYRRYERPTPDEDEVQAVEMLLVLDAPAPFEAGALFSSQLSWPGPEWKLLRREPARLWVLGRQGEFAVLAPPERPVRAVVYTWRIRSHGLWSETWRALLALESSPWRRREPRAAVQLVAFSPADEERPLSQARRRLDRFITRFRASLEAL